MIDILQQTSYYVSQQQCRSNSNCARQWFTISMLFVWNNFM